MIARIFLAAVAVVAIPLTAVGHAQAPAESRETARRTCEVDQQIGSRLGGVRRCLTRAERAQQRAESQNTTERIQSQKNFTEEIYKVGARGVCQSGPRRC
ncbi:MAG TPA: hypothetical protein VJS15_02780 [Allosphingosinicella sp.]|nr:hypothetical protein [Allosphingosinicella sp.]